LFNEEFTAKMIDAQGSFSLEHLLPQIILKNGGFFMSQGQLHCMEMHGFIR
jgi:hypothetical protein